MRYTAVILALVAPIWLVKPLWAEEAYVKETVKYFEDNGECVTIFTVSIEDYFRLPLQFEIDYDYYSSKSVDQRWNKIVALITQKFDPQGKVISDDAKSYLRKKIGQVIQQEGLYIKNSFDENGAKYFDPLYRECVKSFGLDNQ